MRRGIGYNYGPPDPNKAPSRIGDDFFNPDSSRAWWTVVHGSGQITIFCDASLQQNTLKAIATSSPCESLVTKFPKTGSLNTNKKYFFLGIADSTPQDSYGFQVDCRVKAKINDSTYHWYTLRYISEDGTPAESGDTLSFYLGAGYKDGAYHGVMRGLEEDLHQFHSSYSVALFDTLLVRNCVAINGFEIWDRQRSIEGYANLTSVAQGGQIEFHVSMTRQDIDSSYHFEILRAGATMQSMYTSSAIQGHFRTVSNTAFKSGCGWPRDTIFTVPTDWKSGVYLAKLVASNSDFNYIPFIVRASNPGSSSKILFQVSDNTWQAYNIYGGASFYENKAFGRPTVSFNRPYVESYYYIGADGDTVGDRGPHGAGQFFKWEYPLVYWLETHGYAVEYCSNQDLELRTYSDFLDKYNLFLSVGHDEYVSLIAKNNLMNFRNSSKPLDPTVLNPHARNLGFLSGNTIYWRVRYPNGDGRQIYCFFDPDSTADYSYADTCHFSNIGWRGSITALNRGVWTFIGTRLQVKTGRASHWIFRNTGLSDGDKFGVGVPNYPGGISGYEIDYRSPNATHAFEFPDSVGFSNVTVLADTIVDQRKVYLSCTNGCSGGIPPDNVCAPVCSTYIFSGDEAVYYEYPAYTGPSRSKVFSAGCIQWSWGLKDADSLTNKVTKNICDGLASTVRGTISQNLTWSGDIYLGGDVTVDTGATLTIYGGTRIFFFTNDVERSNADTTKVEIIVKGNLRVNGTLANPVQFVSYRKSFTNDWQGFVVKPGGSAKFFNCRFKNAVTGIDYQNTANDTVWGCHFDTVQNYGIITTNSNLRIAKDSFETIATYGVYLNQANSIIDSCYFKDNGTGIYAYKSYGQITHNKIIGTCYHADVGFQAQDIVPNQTQYLDFANNLDSGQFSTAAIVLAARIKLQDSRVRIYKQTCNPVPDPPPLNIGVLGTGTDSVIVRNCYMKSDGYSSSAPAVVEIDATPTIDLGRTGADSGKNSILRGTGGKAIVNYSGSTVYAQNDWWGTSTPDSSQLFNSPLTITFRPILTSQPTPPTAPRVVGSGLAENNLPTEYSLGQNYPNPFNPSTTIRYALPEAGRVKLTIFNLLGQTVRTVVNEDKPVGVHQVVWNGTDEHGVTVASGLYFYKIEAQNFKQVKRMVFLK